MTKFRILPIFAILAVLLLAGAGLVWAQGSNGTPSPDQPTAPMTGTMMGGPTMGGSMMDPGTMGDHDAMQARHQQMLDQMQAMNARLDSLVATMDQARGERKVDAMADVVHELVAQRTAMNQAMGWMQPGMMMQMMQAMHEVPMGNLNDMGGSMHGGSMHGGSMHGSSMPQGSMGSGSMHGGSMHGSSMQGGAMHGGHGAAGPTSRFAIH